MKLIRTNEDYNLKMDRETLGPLLWMRVKVLSRCVVQYFINLDVAGLPRAGVAKVFVQVSAVHCLDLSRSGYLGLPKDECLPHYTRS